MNGIKIGTKIKVKNSEIQGIVKVKVDNAVKLEIIKGNTPITDYYIHELEIID